MRHFGRVLIFQRQNPCFRGLWSSGHLSMARAARDFFKDFDVLTHENRNFRSAPESLSHRQGHLLRPPGETIWLVLLTSRFLNGGSRLYTTKDHTGRGTRMIGCVSVCGYDC